jgi:phosphoribosyl-ATP pyrophosphohydrolase
MNEKLTSFTLYDLERIIEIRKKHPTETSHVAMQLGKGETALCNKLLEEIAEVIVESRQRNKRRITEELGDVFFRALVLAAWHGIRLEDIEAYLSKQHSRDNPLVKPAGFISALVKRLAPFESRQDRLSLARLSEATGFHLPQGTEFVLFSPLLMNAGRTGLLRKVNVFPAEVKGLRTFLESRDIKVKMGIKAGEFERYIDRRSESVLSVIMYVVQFVALPIALNLLAAYLKENIEIRRREGASQQKDKVEIRLVVGAEVGGKERTYVLEGDPHRVARDLAAAQVEQGDKKLVTKGIDTGSELRGLT